MGRGNWLPPDGYEDRMVYVSYRMGESGDDESIMDDHNYEDLKWCIREHLPASFEAVKKWEEGAYVLFSNGLVEILLGDNESCAAVVVRAKKYAPKGLAYAAMMRTADKLFDALMDGYEVRVRQCAWTTAPYRRRGKVNSNGGSHV